MEAVIELQEGTGVARTVLTESENLDALQADIDGAISEFRMWLDTLRYGTESPEFTASESGRLFGQGGNEIVVEKASPAIVSIVDEAAGYHETFVESAHDLIDQRREMLNYYFEYSDKNWDIENFLTLVELQHVQWIDELGDAATTNTSFTGETDPTKCFFGRWYYAYSVGDPEVEAILKELEPLHNALHGSAVTINSLGSAEAKRSVFDTDVAELKLDIRGIFDDLSGYLGPTLESLNASMVDYEHAVEAAATQSMDVLQQLESAVDSDMAIALDEANRAQRTGTIVLVLAAVVAGIAALGIGIPLARSIATPLGLVTGVSEQIAAGNFKIQNVEVKSRDELGTLAGSFQLMVDSLRKKADAIKQIAQGDLTVDIQKASAEDELGDSLILMAEQLSSVLGQVRDAAEQVASGSSQVSSSSQNLSSGATEQASSLEEISSSVNEINGQSKQNADNATEASNLAKQAATDARSGDEQMSELQGAMQSISHSAEEIKKVVKVIDDIAFQINLLALNANVEAARAGKYGKGFAVVAEEVRNLAVRSGSAVQETTAMVEQAVASIETGTSVAEQTGAKLTQIVTGVTKVADYLEEIAAASREQSSAIEQITEGLGQVDQVTQANTASAEESAAASEELAAQAQQLQAAVATFKIHHGNGDSHHLLAPGEEEVTYLEEADPVSSR